ncbi:MAG: ATP-binding cassette domain-containing protein [Magnetococcales bacterium]|nr:ATP-binding cassette domain-containing protein [Magnetococcales bacterium]
MLRRKGVYFHAIVATLVVNALTLATSIYALQVYDRVIPHAGYQTLYVLASGVALAIVIELILKHARGAIIDRTSAAIDAELSEWLFGRTMGIHMHHRPPSLGTFASQIKGIEFLQGILSSSSFFLMTDVPFALFFIWVIFVIGGPVGLVPLVLLPVALLAGLLFQRQVNRGTLEKARYANFRTGLLVEAIDGVEAIKANGAEWRLQSQWRELTEQAHHTENRIKRLSSFSNHVTNSLLQLGYVGLVSVGAVLVIDMELTMGGLIACSIISSRALSPIGRLPGLMLQWAQLNAAVKDLDRLIALPNDLDDRSHALNPESLEPSLRLEGVKFRYAGSDAQALEIPALAIGQGERIGLVGPVGSGKSTLLKVVSGLYRPGEGRLFIGGLDMALIAPQSLRELIGYVSQELRLIRGTLRDNLLQGLPDPGDAALLAAVRTTGLHNLVNSHPKGLALPITEGGRGISGGQKQLIGLTRLLLAKPSLLLLDEPTASMDSETEAKVVGLLRSLADGGTTIVVATHKSALLPLVDRLLVVNDGKIVLDGPRDAVLGRVASKPPTTPTTEA